MKKKPTVLMILDGYGLNETKEGNAVALAKTPVMDQLMKEYPFVKGNGQFGSGTYEYGCRTYHIPGFDKDYKDDTRW